MARFSGQRARGDADKDARRADLLDAGGIAFDAAWPGRPTLAEVAELAGMKKPTAYLYFSSKEALLLALLERELDAWMGSLGLSPGMGPRAVADRIAASLVERIRMRRLLGLLHGELEPALDLDGAIAFKKALGRRLIGAGSGIEAAAGLAPGAGGPFLLRLHALVIGVSQLADPPPMVDQAMDRPELSWMRVPFESTLADALYDWLSAAGSLRVASR